MAKITYMSTGGAHCAYVSGRAAPATWNDDHPNSKKLLEAVKAQDAKSLDRLLNVTKTLTKFTNGKVAIRDGKVFYGERELNNKMTEEILSLMRNGFPFEPLVKCLERLKANPSKRANDTLWEYMQRYRIAIDEDGFLILYKSVRGDWKDWHSNSIDNSIGKVVEMDRNEVCDDPNSACSKGLHAGAIEYVGKFVNAWHKGDAQHVIAVRVDPMDVVCVPHDHDWAKVRVCKYQVFEELGERVLDEILYSTKTGSLKSVAPTYPDDYDDDSDCDDSDYEDSEYEDSECDDSDCYC